MKEKKVIILSGSPRKKGLLNEMLHVAEKQAIQLGKEVVWHQLNDEEIACCKGCMSCRNSGKCVIDDDAGRIMQEIKECDLLVVGSPTYFANVSGPMKQFFDRIVYGIMDDNDSSIPRGLLNKNQKYILMTTCNTPFPFDRLAHQSTGCIRAMKEVFHIAGMKMVGKVIVSGTRKNRTVPVNQIEKLVKNALK